MLLIDHLLFAVIAFVHPIAGYISWQRLLRRIAAGETVNRPQLYSMTIAGHWTLFAVTLALWAGAGRGWTELGFGLTRNAWFAAGVLLAVLAVILLVFQLRYVRKMPRDELLEGHLARRQECLGDPFRKRDAEGIAMQPRLFGGDPRFATRELDREDAACARELLDRFCRLALEARGYITLVRYERCNVDLELVGSNALYANDSMGALGSC